MSCTPCCRVARRHTHAMTKPLPRALALLTLLPLTAVAHEGHGLITLGGGLVHPFLGLDHLLAMVTVGLLAARTTSLPWWSLPTLFLGSLVPAALLGSVLGGVPGLEHGVALAVVALGLLLALGAVVPARWALLLVAVAGATHGWAHGTEVPSTGSAVPFVIGMTLASAVLHLGGAVVGRLWTAEMGARWAGASIAVAGLVLTATL